MSLWRLRQFGCHIGAAIVMAERFPTRFLFALYRRKAMPGAVAPLLFSCGSKNVIPKGRTDSKASVIVVIMMTKMVLFQPQPDSAFHAEMVYRVMDCVVAHVAEDQAG